MPERRMFTNFAGGINNNTPANQIEDNEVVDAQNVVFDKRSNFKTRSGLVKVNYNKNLIGYSEDFSAYLWDSSVNVTADQEDDINGLTTADNLEDDSTENSELISQTIAGVATDVTAYASIFIKKDLIEGLNPVLGIEFDGGGTDVEAYVAIDLIEGTAVSFAASGSVVEAENILVTDFDTYWRVSFSLTNNSTGNEDVTWKLYPNSYNGSSTFSGSDTGTITAWGAQLEFGSLSRYAKNEYETPLLVSNYLEESQDFTSWGGISATENTDVAPDGTTTADSIEDGNAGSLLVITHPTTPLGEYREGTSYRSSVFIKKAVSSQSFYPAFKVTYAGGFDADIEASVILDHFTGDIIPTSADPPTGEYWVEDFGDYWRVVLVEENDSDNNAVSIQLYPAYANAFDGGSDVSATGTIVAWGAQISPMGHSKIYIDWTGGPTDQEGSLLHYALEDPITSQYEFRRDDGTTGYYIACGDTLYRLNVGYFESVTSFIALPDNAYWEWFVYDNVLYGVNGSSVSSESPFVSLQDNNVSSFQEVSVSFNPQYARVWNNRAWLADGNTVYASRLGDPTNHSTAGNAGSQAFEIGGEEGSPITALHVHRDTLFIFKEDAIYYVVSGSPNTDISQYEVKLLSSTVGCISAGSIQTILEDVVFLSRHGLCSLQAVQQFGNFAESVLSQKIEDLTDFTYNSLATTSAILPSESQYMVIAPLEGGTVNSDFWVMDYSGIQEREVGFTRFSGKIVGASLGTAIYNGKPTIYIGGYVQDDGYSYLYRYGDEGIYDDDGDIFDVVVKSKAYNVEEYVNNKIFRRVYFIVELLTEQVDLGLAYFFNEDTSRTKSWVVSLSGDSYTGAIWGVSLWGEGLWASQNTLERRIKRKVLKSGGKVASSIQLTVSSGFELQDLLEQDIRGQAFILKSMGFDFDYASHHKGF